MEPNLGMLKGMPRILTGLKDWMGRWFKKEAEIHLLCSRVALHLEQFADGCYDVSHDDGYEETDGRTYARVVEPVLELESLNPDWLLLSSELRYMLVELPVRVKRMHSFLSHSADMATPPDNSEYFQDRQDEHARMGIHVVELVMKLRRYAKLPNDGRAVQALQTLRERSAAIAESRAEQQKRAERFNTWLLESRKAEQLALPGGEEKTTAA